jgi:hypothetical protein
MCLVFLSLSAGHRVRRESTGPQAFLTLNQRLPVCAYSIAHVFLEVGKGGLRRWAVAKIVILSVAGLLVLVGVVKMFPDFIRYMKIRSM